MIDEKTNELFKKWRNVANILARDPLAKVKCPECDTGYLRVKDEVVEKYGKLDRYMICDNCGRYNVMTMGIPENYNDTNYKRKET